MLVALWRHQVTKWQLPTHAFLTRIYPKGRKLFMTCLMEMFFAKVTLANDNGWVVSPLTHWPHDSKVAPPPTLIQGSVWWCQACVMGWTHYTVCCTLPWGTTYTYLTGSIHNVPHCGMRDRDSIIKALSKISYIQLRGSLQTFKLSNCYGQTNLQEGRPLSYFFKVLLNLRF